MERGLEVHVLDRAGSGPKPELVRALGATYHTGTVAGIGFEPDIIVECTAVGELLTSSVQAIAPGGIVCLTSVGAGGSSAGLAPADVAAAFVLRNNLVVGSVNANKRHWYGTGPAWHWLAPIPAGWRGSSRGAKSPDRFMEALQRKPDDIKTVIQFADV